MKIKCLRSYADKVAPLASINIGLPSTVGRFHNIIFMYANNISSAVLVDGSKCCDLMDSSILQHNRSLLNTCMALP